MKLSKHILLFLLLLTGLNLLADEFKVLQFSEDANNIAAITQKHKRLDDNDEICAIIKVRTDIINLKFTASTAVVGNVEWLDGEYWVYLSGDTRQLSFFTDGFIKFSYSFPKRIEKGKVYVLKLTSKTGLRIEQGKGSLVLTSIPDSAEVRIDGIPDIVKYTPCTFNNYRAGKYRFNFSLNRYHILDSIIRIEKETTKQIQVNLTPITTSIRVFTTPSDAEIFIDNEYAGRSPFTNDSIIIGKHTVRIAHNGYVGEVRDILLKQNTPEELNIKLRNRLTITIESIPTNADVLINGVLKGKTPLKTIVDAGDNKITLKKKYYEIFKDTLKIDKEKTYSFKLALLKFQLNVSSNPSDANFIIDGKKMGTTPKGIKLTNGNHKVVFEKDDYFRKKKKISLYGDQELSVNLKQRYIAYFNFEFIDTYTGYDIIKAGFELGWSYKNADRLLTGFGYSYGDRSVINYNNVYNIDGGNYQMLNTSNMAVDGFIEKKVNNFYLKMGLVIPRPVLLVVTGNVMYNDVVGYKVFISDNHYKSDNNYDDLHAGDKFYDEGMEINQVNIIYGIGVILPLIKSFQISMDYFISNNFINFTPKFMFGFGYRFRK